MTSNIRNINVAGFTLVEMMVVMVILTIGLLPLALVQTRAQRDVFDSGEFSEAVRVAELQMESAKALGFGNVAPDTGLADGKYLWLRGVQNLSPSLDQISVSVTWKESGETRSVMVTNRISTR